MTTEVADSNWSFFPSSSGNVGNIDISWGKRRTLGFEKKKSPLRLARSPPVVEQWGAMGCDRLLPREEFPGGEEECLFVCFLSFLFFPSGGFSRAKIIRHVQSNFSLDPSLPQA